MAPSNGKSSGLSGSPISFDELQSGCTRSSSLITVTRRWSTLIVTLYLFGILREGSASADKTHHRGCSLSHFPSPFIASWSPLEVIIEVIMGN